MRLISFGVIQGHSQENIDGHKMPIPSSVSHVTGTTCGGDARINNPTRHLSQQESREKERCKNGQGEPSIHIHPTLMSGEEP